MARTSDQATLDEAFEGLEREVPARVARAVRWVRDPAAKWMRIPVGLLLIGGSFAAVLPVLGIWMLPLGLLVIAIDLPFLREPVGRMMLWLERKWVDFRHRRARH